MSRIRSKNTSIEIRVRKYFRNRGYKYKLNAKLPGRPDLVFSKEKIVIFTHGCFWHGHTCTDGHIPKSNSIFWDRKISINKLRDKKVTKLLRKSGWKVFSLYECGIEKNLDKKALPILKKLKSSNATKNSAQV